MGPGRTKRCSREGGTQDFVLPAVCADFERLKAFCPPYNPVREGEMVLYDSKKVAETVTGLREALCAFLRRRAGGTPLFVGLAEGGLWITQQMLGHEDTCRVLGGDIKLALVEAKRYVGQMASGSETVITPCTLSAEDFKKRIAGQPVIIVDDMLDEGRSIIDVKASLEKAGATSCHCLVFAARFPMDHYKDICSITIGKPLILEEDYPGKKPWVFGCGPDWGVDDRGSEEKRLSRYRAEPGEGSVGLNPVMVAFAHSMS